MKNEDMVNGEINKIDARVKELLNEPENVSLGFIEIDSDEGMRLSLETQEKGTDGIKWIQGRPENLESNAKYLPITARGVSGNLGLYQTYAETDPDFADAHQNIVQNLQRGSWEITANEWIEEDQLELHREIIKFSYKALFSHISWKQFIQEWASALITGFAIWEPVYTKDGMLKKLAQRKSFITNSWILDELERELIAVKFRDAKSKEVIISADELLIYSHMREGTNFEGKSLIRPIAFYIELKQYLLKTFAASAEVNGLGMKVIETNDESDASEDAQIVTSVSNARAINNPVISLPNGKTIRWLSPQGQSYDVKSMLEYCDQKIKSILSAEGSLLGLNNVGSFALASEKGKGEIAASQFFGELICDLFNQDGSPLRAMIDVKFGPQEYYPLLTFRAQEEEGLTPEKVQGILGLKAAGMEMTTDDWNILRKSYGLAPIIEDDSDMTDEEIIQEEIQASHDHGEVCGCDDHKKKELSLAVDDVNAYRVYFEGIEKDIAKELYEQSKDFMKQYAEIMSTVTTPSQLLQVERTLEFNRDLFIERIKPQIREGLLKGTATTMKEMGIVSSLGSYKNIGTLFYAEIEDFVQLMAYRIGTHEFNVVQSYLQDQAIQNLNNIRERKRLTIPTLSAMQKTVGQYTGEIINKGRESTIMAIEGLSSASKPIPAIRISVLEQSTCKTCRELDGKKAFVGSSEYYRLSPPNLCEGRGRCRCIWTYELPDTDSYRDVLQSMTGLNFSFSESVEEEDGFHHLIKYIQ